MVRKKIQKQLNVIRKKEDWRDSLSLPRSARKLILAPKMMTGEEKY